MKIRALAGWFGSNRMLAENVGAALTGCSWVGIPFAGSMSEIPYIGARTLLVNDLHRHIINLARCVANDASRYDMVCRLKRKAFHPDELKEAQEICSRLQPLPTWATPPDVSLATAYFVCCWMGRASKAGIDDEFNGRPSIRWKSDGGDSVVRYWSALRSLASWGKTLRRCSFETMDYFDFLARCEDIKGHGIYCDPPFPGVGRRYKHNAGQTDEAEREWHTRLRDALERFTLTRVVCRFYEHPLIRELYSDGSWEWNVAEGRKQSNEAASEILLTRNTLPPTAKDVCPLFGESV